MLSMEEGITFDALTDAEVITSLDLKPARNVRPVF